MSDVSKKKSPLEIAELMLLHNPGASLQGIANVISEWGDLSDDHRFDNRRTVAIETAAPAVKLKSGSLNID